MIPLLRAVLVSGPPWWCAPRSRIEPFDDVRVDSGAGDQGWGAYQRRWGNERGSEAPLDDGSLAFSHRRLIFVPLPDRDPQKTVSARAAVTHVGEIGCDAEAAKLSLIEIRDASAPFGERAWAASGAATAPFGSGWARPGQEGGPFQVAVGLFPATADFRAALPQAVAHGGGAHGASSKTMDPAADGGSALDEFSSKLSRPDLRPAHVTDKE